MASLVAVGPAYDAAGELRVAEQASVAWISARPEYWHSIDGDRTPEVLHIPEPGLGVACLVFGVGAGGADWIDRLERSDWFAGLEPRPDDLAVAGGTAAGRWTVPVGRAAGRGSRIAGEIKALVARARLPNAPLATVAVPRGAGSGDLEAALALVSALRQRRDAAGCRTAVIVTVEAGPPPAAGAFVRGLLDQGAFVVQAGLGVSDDHIHHFPLRAVMVPRRGRLVCVDLADHLACWAPGGTADLHVIPSAFDEAARALSRLLVPGDATSSQVRALNLHAHCDLDAPGITLAELDRLAMHCRGLFLRPDGDMVFTTADRLDGVTGSADLLLIHGPHRPPVTSVSVADAAH